MSQNMAMKIINEVRKAVVGKDTVLAKTMIAILAQGHILLEDNPGVGKTTLALAFSRAMGLEFGRVQFTPEVMPADIVGFSVYNRESGRFEYHRGAAMCNLFLADEINRTSAKTQSALLEIMEEGQATVDGATHRLPPPFTVIATQNPNGSAGTNPLPESQLDRFTVRLSLGYPELDDEVEILKQTEGIRPIDTIVPVATLDDVLNMQNEAKSVHISDEIYYYIAGLCAATRESKLLKSGASPRAGIALAKACRATARLADRDYVIPQDVRFMFYDVLEHRVTAKPSLKVGENTAHAALKEVYHSVEAPRLI